MAKNKNNNLSSLGKQLRDELKVVYKEHNEFVKTIARQVMKDVTEGTVIDTSKAVSNWVATLDTPHSGEINAHYQGKGGSTGGESIDVALLKANNAINNRKPGQSIFITNDIEGDSYQRRARVGESAQEAMDDAITSVAKAELLIGVSK